MTDTEVHLAVELGIPINGTRPELRRLGTKSEGRRLMARAGVPIPPGYEDVVSVDDVIEGVVALRHASPGLRGVVVKHDDSGAGDGNAVIDVDPHADDGTVRERVREQLAALPAWYREDLARGGIVEERVQGQRFASPSAQVDVLPDGAVVVLATHEQVLGGPSDQVYLGCRFPADPAYATRLADHAAAVGRLLAAEGVIGRFGVDFVAAADGDGDWQVFAIEINLRKGGTTHPYTVLRNIVPGHYEPERGGWVADRDGSPRWYSASDNVVDPAWRGLPPRDVIEALRAAGLEFHDERGSGVVLHMLSGLAIDGRFGLTAIGRSQDEAASLHEATRATVDGLAAARG